jgi:hypothetical protein
MTRWSQWHRQGTWCPLWFHQDEGFEGSPRPSSEDSSSPDYRFGLGASAPLGWQGRVTARSANPADSQGGSGVTCLVQCSAVQAVQPRAWLPLAPGGPFIKRRNQVNPITALLVGQPHSPVLPPLCALACLLPSPSSLPKSARFSAHGSEPCSCFILPHTVPARHVTASPCSLSPASTYISLLSCSPTTPPSRSCLPLPPHAVATPHALVPNCCPHPHPSGPGSIPPSPVPHPSGPGGPSVQRTPAPLPPRP